MSNASQLFDFLEKQFLLPSTGDPELNYMRGRKFNNACRKLNSVVKVADGHCPHFFDGATCWNATAPGTTAVMRCVTWALNNPIKEHSVSLRCLSNGSWDRSESLESKYAYCDTEAYQQIRMESLFSIAYKIRIAALFGYLLSAICLLLALYAFVWLKKLHCLRNRIHFNLFLSLLLRMFTCSIEVADSMFFHKINRSEKCDNSFADLNFWCKAFSFLWNYSIFASYVWISIEGYYLFSIIYRAVFNGDISCKRYMVAGWGVPFVFVSIWAVFMQLYSNSPCWIHSCNPYLVWILKTPLGICSLANIFFTIFLFFQLYKKLFLDDHLNDRSKYSKLIKSTICVLLTMGGVYFIIDIVVYATSPDMITNIQIHMFYVIYNSLISCLIAYLFCFNNSEIKQAFRSKRRHSEKESEMPLNCTHGHLMERLVVGNGCKGCPECQVEMRLLNMKEVSPTVSKMLASTCETVCTTVESSAHNTVTRQMTLARPRVNHLSFCREAEEEDAEV
ncbi:hypothetical protein L596_017398 [Steinernema carpocapsae]|uniref:G-protein coupled receptors family 2 profile 2 domain-containing protein n=1 Tax=Steinernema carpocapsae TaxID=34508 RepID=A0A4U5N1J8_STECR|nr:hypothetical protein L596_017398 [Steinernema carpocapsae]